MANWTKGPWHVEQGEKDIDDNQFYVCHKGTECDQTTIAISGDCTKLISENKSTADLISAAPDMAEALEEIIETIKQVHDGGSKMVKMRNMKKLYKCAKKCEKALSKAKGETE